MLPTTAQDGTLFRPGASCLEESVADMDFDLVIRLLQALHDASVEYVLVGGVAMSVHGLVRATEDIDLFVRLTSDNVARLRAALHEVWNDPNIDDITIEDLAGEYPVVRYGPPDTQLVVDILARLGSAFAYEDLEWEVLPLDGVEVRVATPRTLHRMKCDTVRPIDKIDAARLRAEFPQDIDDAG